MCLLGVARASIALTGTGALRRSYSVGVGGSDDANALSLISLAALADFELDALTFFERAVTRSLDVREVNEHVVAVLSRDEAEALLVVEELDCSCRHVMHLHSLC